MSYILDALTKAAQQRDRHVPVVQRLLTHALRPRSRWSRWSGRLLVALAINAGLLTTLLVWWLLAVPVAAPPAPLPVAAPTPAEPPQPARLEPPRTDVHPETPAPRGRDAIAESAASTAKSRAPQPTPPATPLPAAPVIQPPPAPRSAAAVPQAPPPGRSAAPLTQPAPSPTPLPAAPVTRPAPSATVTPPVASVGPATPSERARLKLEALIYSDVPAQRMVFINGRRYAEGDVIDGRLRIEEIHEDGVELSTDGRRFTLRVAR